MQAQIRKLVTENGKGSTLTCKLEWDIWESLRCLLKNCYRILGDKQFSFEIF